MIKDAILGAVPEVLVNPGNGPTHDEPRHRSVKALLKVIPYALAFGLLGWALAKNRHSIHEVINRGPDTRYLFLAFLLSELALMSTFTRWYVLARAQGIPVTLREAFHLGFLGHASELVVPGQLGGDVVKAVAFCRRQARRAPVIASVMFDRVTGVFGLFLLVSFMGALQWPSATVPVRRILTLVWAVTGLGGLAFALLFLPAAAALVRRVLGRGRLAEKLAGLWDAVAAYRGHKAVVLAALALAMVSHLMYALSFYAVSRALFPVTPPLSTYLVIVPLILFTAIVPLPFGALGVGEGVSDELFRLLGHAIGTPAMIGARVVGLAVSGVSLVIYLSHTRSASVHGSGAVSARSHRLKFIKLRGSADPSGESESRSGCSETMV